MSTRGCFGVRIDGKDFLTYNHSDSYPEWLGIQIVESLREMDVREMQVLAKKLQLVEAENHPTLQEYSRVCIALGKKFEEEESIELPEPGSDWYTILHDFQGDLNGILELGVMMDYVGFLNDSLFCEWAYIVNLDECVLEVYQGYQSSRGKGRYALAAKEAEDGYWPVSLVETYEFVWEVNDEESRKDWVDSVVKEMKGLEMLLSGEDITE